MAGRVRMSGHEKRSAAIAQRDARGVAATGCNGSGILLGWVIGIIALFGKCGLW